ncbi:MAG: hypothetical protein JO035_00315 [Betaproteobacteria bacterium]|nr:hypothetical protein [Betaproteobacteria bacterium]
MDARLTMEAAITGMAPARQDRPAARREQRLPFTIRVAGTEEQLQRAVDVRYRAYGRHVPVFAEKLRAPEAMDRASGCVVLLAESRLDGEPLGTMRIQTNRDRPLPLESLGLPDWLQNRRLAQASRLGVETGRMGTVVKTALFKAYYLFCRQASIEWAVIAGRPPLDRMYEALCFQDVFPGELIPLPFAGNLPHRIMAVEVDTLAEQWQAAGHRLHEFFFATRHDDIDLSLSRPEATALPSAVPSLPRPMEGAERRAA